MRHRHTMTAVTLLLLATSGAAFADDDCNIPVADWQPRDALRQQIEQQHQDWTIHRIKVDDGCYEVKASDQDGNKIEADYAPDTLQIRKLEIEYRHTSDAGGVRDNDGNGGKPANPDNKGSDSQTRGRVE